MKMTKRISSILLTLVLALGLFVGCGSKEVAMKDREGNDFTKPAKVERIISTAPSNTEVLVELGLKDNLVAVDKYSSDVEGVSQDLPMLDFRNPDVEAIIALNPDVILASGHNKAGDEDPFKAVKEAGIAVAYIPSSDSLDGIYKDIEFIGEVTDKKKEANSLVVNMKKEVADIKAIGDTITSKKKVYFEIGSGSGLYSFGNGTFLNEMISIIGAENIFASEEGWISPSEEAVITNNPDVILTNEAYLENPVQAIATRKAWEGVNAVKNNEIYLLDMNATSRPSQNVVKALKEMAKAIYPEKYE